MKRLIIFLIRKRLGLRKNEPFRFSNQKSNAFYYFTSTQIMKNEYGYVHPSDVKLNWMLDDECIKTIIPLAKEGRNEKS